MVDPCLFPDRGHCPLHVRPMPDVLSKRHRIVSPHPLESYPSYTINKMVMELACCEKHHAVDHVKAFLSPASAYHATMQQRGFCEDRAAASSGINSLTTSIAMFYFPC